MTTLLIEGGDYTIVILLFLLFFFGIPIILGIIALTLRRKKPKTAKVLGIITAVYLIISLGYCGIMTL
ncbi:hypothetical protein [Flavivirga spongiicola]|uniref:Uncharacterized protein n=1 Tax=Flavivirga spongiicola TaxID=421621 RepID=A0ABU7XTZ3_9FLAO|nr:hypothetical protein [Flavivirga sp. MEBiC05379]MDO5978977.1 hypothetical protein [Flavivirga sp. MEBiC05379]